MSQANEPQDAVIERLERTVALLQDRISMLEVENTKFSDMLKERGVDMQSSSRIALELPPVIRKPVDRNSEVLAMMTPSERKLLEDICLDEPLLLVLKSDSLIDTGGWFRRSRVWVCATTQELGLLAFGRSSFFQKTPFRALHESLYNHVTGELVLAPALELKLPCVKVPPLDGYQLLAQIYQTDSVNNETGDNHA